MSVQLIDDLKAEYNADEQYFELLSNWFASGRFIRRTQPILATIQRYVRADSVVLDAGCAAGAMTIEVAKLGVARIDAVDFSSTALRFADRNVRQFQVADRVCLIESKLEELDQPDNTYDLIMAADVIEHIADPQAFLTEMLRVCKPGGVIIVETPNTLFRQHPWYARIASFTSRLGFPDSQNLFPVEIDINWERYHLSAMTWPKLEQVLKASGWSIQVAHGFGWWLKFGTADTFMRWISRIGKLFGSDLRYYGDTDVLIVARKEK